MPEAFVNGALNGVLHYFPNAADPRPSPLQPHTDREHIRLRIMGATAHDRYTKRLADTDLRRVIYVYGTADAVVGRLTDEEIAFLHSRGSSVIPVQDGSHLSVVIDPAVVQQILDACRNKVGMARRFGVSTLTYRRPEPAVSGYRLDAPLPLRLQARSPSGRTEPRYPLTRPLQPPPPPRHCRARLPAGPAAKRRRTPPAAARGIPYPARRRRWACRTVPVSRAPPGRS